MEKGISLSSPGSIVTLLALIIIPLIVIFSDFSEIKSASSEKQKEFQELESLEDDLNSLENDLLGDIDPSLLEGLDLEGLEDLDTATNNALTTQNNDSTNTGTIASSTESGITENKNGPYKTFLLLSWGILLIAFLFQVTSPSNRIKKSCHKVWLTIEKDMSVLSLGLLLLFTLNSLLEKAIHAEIIYGNSGYLTHSVILVALLGATLAFKNREHISLTIAEYILPKDKMQNISIFTSSITAIILFTFLFSSLQWPQSFSQDKQLITLSIKNILILFLISLPLFILWARYRKIKAIWAIAVVALLFVIFYIAKWPFNYDTKRTVLTLPLYRFLYVIPVGLLVISLRVVLQRLQTKSSLIPIVVGLTVPLIIKIFFPTEIPSFVIYCGAGVLIIGTFLGVPVFAILTGFAMLFIYNEDKGNLVRVLTESYEVLTLEEYATIPLFTISGFLLSFSKSGERLIRFFKALFGPIPGGIAIVAVLVSAFFTTFTGASGVTILALGGLLHYIMTKDGYSDRFTTGYLTSSGSIGLLFPPALPIILFGVQAKVNIIKLFAGGFLPGVLLVSSVSLYGIIKARKIPSKEKVTFCWKELYTSFKDAIFEIILPIIIIYLFFSGKAVIVETAAFSVLYLMFVQIVIHKDIKSKQLPSIFLKAASVAGSVLIILVGAKALSSQIIIAQIPQHLTEWCQDHIHHKWTFLLILNIALLITGFFMDIFSAIMVIVPLILPISKAFGIDPVHLGIIFLANLEVGYLTPPVGLNLFLSALTFKKSLIKIYRSVLPFLFIMITAVFIITYIPFLTTFGVHMGEKMGLYKNKKQSEAPIVDEKKEMLDTNNVETKNFKLMSTTDRDSLSGSTKEKPSNITDSSHIINSL